MSGGIAVRVHQLWSRHPEHPFLPLPQGRGLCRLGSLLPSRSWVRVYRTCVASQPTSRTPSSNCIYPPALALRRQDFVSFYLTGEGAVIPKFITAKALSYTHADRLLSPLVPRQARDGLFNKLNRGWRNGRSHSAPGFRSINSGNMRLRGRITENKPGLRCQLFGMTRQWSGSHEDTKPRRL